MYGRAQLRAAGTHLLVPSLPGMLAGLLGINAAERDPGLQRCSRHLFMPEVPTDPARPSPAIPGPLKRAKFSKMAQHLEYNHIPASLSSHPVRRRGLPAAQVPRHLRQAVAGVRGRGGQCRDRPGRGPLPSADAVHQAPTPEAGCAHAVRPAHQGSAV
uniref:cDNA n=1 Tax=Macrostomum lignano TaxID=282301 RepID=A0A1I8FPF6_9PLAT